MNNYAHLVGYKSRGLCKRFYFDEDNKVETLNYVLVINLYIYIYICSLGLFTKPTVYNTAYEDYMDSLKF
jgi:hypothetical protein